MTNNSTGRLPIEDYKQIIQETVAKNAVTIITAETGAGKSTQVPQYLHEMGHRVVVTQPRRLAARTLAERVSEEMAAKKKASGEIVRDTRHQLGGLVGFRTGYEKLSGKDTQILFCTDGLQLIHELVGDKNTDILILDEVHEWNINIETLVAWTRQQVKNGEKTKLVVMSATMEAEKLAEYYGEDTPVISVPGRLFPVEESVTHSENLIHEVAQLVKEGRNVLVFQPGKKEIEATIEELKDAGVDAEILPLHGQLEPDEQKLCFRHYDRPKVVVATNVAQTSITIDDIDAVVDRGLERRMELDEGIENLALRPTSNADCKQRAGRAGRCKPGKYVLAEDPKDFHGNERRADFPKAEIERSRLDQLVLRLASLRYDATELDFFHQPNRDTLKDAKRALHALGAIDDNEEVTAMGEMMAKLPLSVEYARMLIEAQKNNVVDDVLTAVSILEQDGILARGDEWRKYTKETESDVLAQLDLWRAAQGKKAKEIREMGIHTKSYFQAKELRRKLVTELKKYRVQLGGKSDRTAILKSIVAGMVDHLYEKRGYSDNYYNGSPNGRQLDRRSVLRSGANWIVGKPLDIEIRTRRGPMQLPLVTNASKVNPDWLPEIAPQLVKKERKGRRWSIKNLAVVEDELTVFNGQTIKEEEKIAQATPQTTELFVQYLAQGYGGEYLLMAFHNHNLQVIERAKELWIRSAGKTIPVAGAALKAHYTKLTEGYAIASSSDLETLIASDKLTARDFRLNLEDYATDDEGRQIEEQNPLTITLGDKEFEVEYSAQEPNWQRSTYNFEARTKLPIAAIQDLERTSLQLPSGRQLDVTVLDQGYQDIRETDIEKLKRKIDNRRLEFSWKEFESRQTTEVVEVKPFYPLPATPEPRIYDEQSGALAYAALSFDNYRQTFHIRWFQHRQDAAKSNVDARAALQSMEERVVEQRRLAELEEKEERRKADEERQLLTMEEKGEILRNFGGRFRIMGRTGQCDHWVIQPDGSLRDPDDTTYRKRYTDEGEKHWNLVKPEELAISWVKESTAAPHECIVKKLPKEGLTQAQRDFCEELESQLEEKFEGFTGASSGKTSPSIGKGWGLKKIPQRGLSQSRSGKAQAESTTELTMEEKLAALKAKFGKR